MNQQRRTRYRPLDALRALRALSRDPDDTGQVFKIVAALSGDTQGRILRRLLQTEVGRNLVRSGRSLIPTLVDRERLRSLPADSLGRAYLAFCERAGITADGLIAASQEGDMSSLGQDEQFVAARMRDIHDLIHVVTGYQTDLVGEASVLAFTVAQTKNPGVALIVLLAYMRPRGPHRGSRHVLRQAFARGRRAAWLPGVDWEEKLSQPLQQVRRELGLSETPVYTPVWPHQVFANKQPPKAATAISAQ
ncbi:MAG TPA: Coq4 family protein [Polyangiales bacterium]